MTIKLPKAEAVEKITALLNLGLSYSVIGQRIGLSKGRVCQIIKDFGLKRLTVLLAPDQQNKAL